MIGWERKQPPSLFDVSSDVFRMAPEALEFWAFTRCDTELPSMRLSKLRSPCDMQHEEGDVNAIPRCWQNLQVTAVRHVYMAFRR